MPRSSPRIKGLVILWSLILLGGYVLFAGGSGLLPSSKSGRVLHEDSEATETEAAPSSKQSAPATQFSLQPTTMSGTQLSKAPTTRPAPILMSGSKSGIIVKPSQVPTGDATLSLEPTTRP